MGKALAAALERGEVLMLFLGNLIHSEEDHQLEEMESSLFMLGVFCVLTCDGPAWKLT
jgi:hypothetical protein